MNASHRPWIGLLATVSVVPLLCTGCAPTSGTPSELPTGAQLVELDPADFSTTIDNPYWPMVPGTRYTYREFDGEGNELEIIITITTAMKEIANGVTARVVRDTVYENGELIEDTFDWYAQHSDGAIWYLGEDTAEFENGSIISTEGSFEAGVDGAMAGIAIPADPQPGMAYRQEYYQGQAEDNGEVMRLNEQVDVAYGHFDQVMTTRDTITIEPDGVEYKFYAKDVGPVMTLDLSGGGNGREELVSVETVGDGAGTGPLGEPD